MDDMKLAPVGAAYTPCTPAFQAPAARRTLPEDLYMEYIRWLDKGPVTTRTYIKNLRQFAAWLKFTGITSPTRDDVIAYRQWLLDDHPAIRLDDQGGWAYRLDARGQPIMLRCLPGTAAQYVRALKQFFHWTGVTGAYPNIADHVSVPKSSSGEYKRDCLSPDEVLAVESSI